MILRSPSRADSRATNRVVLLPDPVDPVLGRCRSASPASCAGAAIVGLHAGRVEGQPGKVLGQAGRSTRRGQSEITDTRRSSSTPLARVENRPSWGSRRSAMSSPEISLMRGPPRRTAGAACDAGRPSRRRPAGAPKPAFAGLHVQVGGPLVHGLRDQAVASSTPAPLPPVRAGAPTIAAAGRRQVPGPPPRGSRGKTWCNSATSRFVPPGSVRQSPAVRSQERLRAARVSRRRRQQGMHSRARNHASGAPSRLHADSIACALTAASAGASNGTAVKSDQTGSSTSSGA